ncbi:hypothetical protein B2I21_07350 [Chryseobacterium mucoviscidosis]|nr:hypothetical protein B2I21_07350 [Chryseobacterium mucoviscidosis]
MIPSETQNTFRTLREWRVYRRLEKRIIAQALDVHPSTYARMEDRPEDVSVSEANVLADVFQCELQEINFFENTSKFNFKKSLPSKFK